MCLKENNEEHVKARKYKQKQMRGLLTGEDVRPAGASNPTTFIRNLDKNKLCKIASQQVESWRRDTQELTLMDRSF
jgi:hypothetical protein